MFARVPASSEVPCGIGTPRDARSRCDLERRWTYDGPGAVAIAGLPLLGSRHCPNSSGGGGGHSNNGGGGYGDGGGVPNFNRNSVNNTPANNGLRPTELGARIRDDRVWSQNPENNCNGEMDRQARQQDGRHVVEEGGERPVPADLQWRGNGDQYRDRSIRDTSNTMENRSQPLLPRPPSEDRQILRITTS